MSGQSYEHEAMTVAAACVSKLDAYRVLYTEKLLVTPFIYR